MTVLLSVHVSIMHVSNVLYVYKNLKIYIGCKIIGYMYMYMYRHTMYILANQVSVLPTIGHVHYV